MTAFFGFTGKGDFLEQMATSLRHWSADREGKFTSDQLSMGCLEMYNVPESDLAPQPFRYENFIIVGDCRIDNREALRKILKLEPDQVMADLEFIVRLYAKKGKETPILLIGDFAFIIWDSKKEELFGARDQLGIKIFYYAIQQEQLVFASEIKGILAYPGMSKEFNELVLATTFSLDGPSSSEGTLYNAIDAQPAGTWMHFKAGTLTLKKYWTLGDHNTIIPETHEERLGKFKDLFFLSVKDRMRTNKRLGLELSGGLDSTGIGGALMTYLGKGGDLSCFSFGKALQPTQEIDKFDEGDLMHEFCEENDLHSQWRKFDERDFTEKDHFNLITKVQDEVDMNFLPTLTAAFLKQAKKEKIGVMFSGWGGDMAATLTLGGFYRPLAIKKRYWALWKDIRRKHDVPMAFIKWLYFSIKFLQGDSVLKTYKEKSKKKYASSPLKRKIIEKYQLLDREPSIYKVKSTIEISDYLSTYLTEVGINKRIVDHGLVGRHFGVDYRFPMMDLRLLEYIYALPIDTITYQGKSRYLFTEIIRPYIPNGVIDKRKSKVPSVPFTKAFQRDALDEIIAFVQANFDELENMTYLDSDKVLSILKRPDPENFGTLSKLMFYIIKKKSNV